MFTAEISRMELARFIDHTYLKPEASSADIERVAMEAKDLGTFALCVNSSMVETAHAVLEGSDVRLASTIGFPFGSVLSIAKARETEHAVGRGAAEVDTVIQIGWLKEKNYRGVAQDIEAVVDAAGGALVKVIIETCLLTDDEKGVA